MGRLAHYDITKFADKRPFMRMHEISSILQKKGFCLMKGEVEPIVRERAIAEANALKDGNKFSRPPKEVLCGLFGVSGSAWVKDMDMMKEGEEVPAEAKNLYDIENSLKTMGEELASGSSAYFDMTIEGRSATKIHCSRSMEDGLNPPLVDPEEAEFYLSLFMLKRLKVVYYLGPTLGTLMLMPIQAEAQVDIEVFSAQIQPGTLVVIRADVCRCMLETRAGDHGLTMEVDFIATTPQSEVVAPPPELDQWFVDRYQAIVENDVTENVPEDWQKSARQVFHRDTPIRILTQHCDVPSAIFEPGNFSPFVASVLGGNDCINAIPAFKWDISLYYDEDPEMTDDFKMYTQHMGYLDRGHSPLEDYDVEDFGLTKDEAETVDKRHLMLCESACLCLEYNGMSKQDTDGEDLGIFCGLSGSDMYFALMSRETKMNKCSIVGTAGIVNRISYMLGSVGPCLAVDTEDSSGSAAADTAVTYLRSGKCGREALLGAANQIPHPFSLIVLCASGLISTTGRSRVFDQKSDGIIRSEGVVSMLLQLHKMNEESPSMKGLFTGSAVNSKGTSSSLTAPNSAAIGDILLRAQKDSGCPAYLLDAVEVHASGRPLADAMEYGKMKNVLVSKEKPPCSVCLRNAASTLGSVGAPGGLVSIARTLLMFEKGTHGPCIHLRQLFEIGATAAEDAEDGGRVCIPIEAIPSRSLSSVVGVTSFGGSGTNVHHVLSGVRKFPKAKEKRGKQLAYFPSNTKLPEIGAPEVGYFICGSWTAYEKPLRMEVESEGVYGYTMTLGENGFETFVIWVDGDKEKVLHPDMPWSQKDAKVAGPEVYGRECVWLIDGRVMKVILCNEEQIEAIEKEKKEMLSKGRVPREPEYPCRKGFPGSFKPPGFEDAKDYVDMPVVDIQPEDEGVPGDKYRIRLYTQGNFKRVSWVKLHKDSVLSLPALEEEPYPHAYFVSGDHNYWSFDQMGSNTGDMSLEIHTLKANSTFQIVRDKDWDQTFFPKYPELTAGQTPCEKDEIDGPSMNGLLKKWKLPNKAGDIYRITFNRETRFLAWQFVKNQKPDMKEITKGHQYYLMGSYSDFRSPIEMKYYKETETWKGIFTATSGKDTFFIMLNKNWLSTVHPVEDEAHYTSSGGRLVGPDDGGSDKYWKLDKTKDAIREGNDVLVEMVMDDGGCPKAIMWGKCVAVAEKAEGDASFGG
mmetsp:Transcript_11471/g.21528  ORF Transcript_11471/g.21528 Transcript_11471/m.21528 type:complete len:1191 (-) Transcript_11471:171-3743(-)